MAHTMAMLMASKKGRRLKLADFLLRWSEPRRRRQSADEQLSILRSFAARHNARTKKD